MTISTTLVTSIVNTFGVTKGYMKDDHGTDRTIQMFGLVARKNIDGTILKIGGVLKNIDHSVNAVGFINGSLSLTQNSIGMTLTKKQSATMESIIDALNENERYMSETILGKPQDCFWEKLVAVS